MFRIDKNNIKKSASNLWIVLIIAGFIVIFLKNALAVQFIQDDAYTSLRYVKNFLNGQGLVFNPGERVEGYTNFLWVIILSVIGFFSKNISLEIVAQYLSVIFSLVLIVLTYILSKLINENKENTPVSISEKIISFSTELIPVILIVYSTPLVYWGVSGMETTLFVSFLLLSIIFYLKGNPEKPNYPFVILSVLNSLLRPEGMIFFLLIISYSVYVKQFSESKRSGNKSIKNVFDRIFLKEIAVYLIPLMVYFCFRLIYYGYLLPNTFYAKSELSINFIKRGSIYFIDFCRTNLAYGLILLLPILIFAYKRSIKRFLFWYWIIFAWIICVVIIGGDVLPIGRFFLPIASLIFILFAQSIRQLIDLIAVRNNYIRYSIYSIVFIIVIAYSVLNYQIQKEEMINKRSYEAGLVQKMKIYARWINDKKEEAEHVPTVAMSTIGAFSFYTNARIIDIVGLTNSYIAHNPKVIEGINDELPVIWKERHYNADYVFKQKPDYIIFPAGGKPSAFAECAIFVNKEFHDNYYTQLFYSEELNQLLPIFTRKPDIEKGNLVNECNVKFVKFFIEANNNFLKMLETRNKDLLTQISSECDSISYYCPERISDALTIRGYSFYHAGEYEEAKKYLTEASNLDPFNTISRLYLKSIFVKKGDLKNAVKLMLQIKKYSPDALPDFDVNF